MIDWLSSMSQTYQFYKVDPNTWKDKQRISNILSCSVKRDLSTETLESASFSTTDIFEECYIRVYLVATQYDVEYKFCLGTFLVQTPSYSFDGKVRGINLDAYSPLLELKDIKPDLGYTIMKDTTTNIISTVSSLMDEHMHAPVVKSDSAMLLPSNYTAQPDDSWLSYLASLVSSADFYYLLDDVGRVLFHPNQDIDSVKPVWVYEDSNSSILKPEISDDYDLYGIPNVVEIVYSDSSGVKTAKVTNDDPKSPTSTVSRGREVLYRDTNPEIPGLPNDDYLKDYATKTLKSFNEVQHTLSYSHGYCGTRIGDCILLNYERAGIKNIKARIITQSIECVSGCPVTETAVYKTNLWKE